MKEEIYIHPVQLHSDIRNINKVWVKENNYFERYQVMTSRKLGLRVGDVGKTIPFTNFKVYSERSCHERWEGDKKGQHNQHNQHNQEKKGSGKIVENVGKFRVMTLDVWNKVIKISHDPKILKAPQDSLLFDLNMVEDGKKYTGFVSSVVQNGVIVEFCNNIRGFLSNNKLKLCEVEISEENVGEGI